MPCSRVLDCGKWRWPTAQRVITKCRQGALAFTVEQIYQPCFLLSLMRETFQLGLLHAVTVSTVWHEAVLLGSCCEAHLLGQTDWRCGTESCDHYMWLMVRVSPGGSATPSLVCLSTWGRSETLASCALTLDIWSGTQILVIEHKVYRGAVIELKDSIQ